VTRETIIDIIRHELLRQANLKQLSLAKADRPDDIRVTGTIDLLAIANAIKAR
jgi:hypothetical protein